MPPLKLMRIPHDNTEGGTNGVIIDFSNPLNLLLLSASLIMAFALGNTTGEYWQEIESRTAKAELSAATETVNKQQEKMVSRWQAVDQFCSTYPTIEE